MPTVHDKVTRIIAVKAAIKDAIEAKGPTVGSIPFDEYAGKIAEIADLSAAQAAVEAVNGEPSADLTAGIALTASTKLAIETAIETAGVDVPALTPFADYADYVADVAEYAYFFFDTATKTIHGYNSHNGSRNMVIPSRMYGINVENIAQSAFQLLAQQSIFSAYFPDTVKNLGVQAFYGQALTTIRLPENVLCIRIPNNFCYGVGTLLKLTAPINILEIGNRAFFVCSAMSEIEIPSVTSIEEAAFFLSPIIKIIIGDGCAITPSGQPTMGVYGNDFETLYNGNGQLAGTYEYAAGTWSKTA